MSNPGVDEMSSETPDPVQWIPRGKVWNEITCKDNWKWSTLLINLVFGDHKNILETWG